MSFASWRPIPTPCVPTGIVSICDSQRIQMRPSDSVVLTRNRLGIALDALAKIPVIGPDVTASAQREIGKGVRLTLEGPVRTWAHRALGSIDNEAVLRRVLLRLLQGTLPRYAQIRHGPIKYGEDIA